MNVNWNNKSTNKLVLGLCRMLFAGAALLLVSCSDQSSAAQQDTYTCPMHPSVLSDHQGTCPVCGMDLVRKARAGEEVKITDELARLIKSPNEKVVADIATVKGEYKAMPVTLTAHGVVTYDTRHVYAVPARVAGRLEKVFVKYAFQQVRKGEKIAVLYSPEMETAQRELLFLLRNDSGNEQLITLAKDKLRLLGATDKQIDRLIERQSVDSQITLYSPHSGYVVTELPTAAAAEQPASMPVPAMDGRMAAGTRAPTRTNATAQLIREGDYVTTGQTLFYIIDPSSLRIDLALSARDASRVTKGSAVQLHFPNGKMVAESIDLIQPFIDEGGEQAIARVYFQPTQHVQPGALVEAVIAADDIKALWLPRSAISALGNQTVVFVKDKGVFTARPVTVAWSNNDDAAVVQGISSADEVAANAAFLVDSESFTKSN